MVRKQVSDFQGRMHATCTVNGQPGSAFKNISAKHEAQPVTSVFMSTQKMPEVVVPPAMSISEVKYITIPRKISKMWSQVTTAKAFLKRRRHMMGTMTMPTCEYSAKLPGE